jgi:hypothetical protein
MGVALDKVVPWGRSLKEYVPMFSLTEDDLRSKVLDCAGGPASFNVEMTRRGSRVVSCDPIYAHSAAEIAGRIKESCPSVLENTKRNYDRFLWREIPSLEHLDKLRMTAMHQFLDDFAAGIEQGRYIAGELPSLPFGDGEFDLALCSHFLFTYGNVLSLEFHCDSIRELCRVAREARVFPLLGQFGAEHSPHVPPLVSKLRAEGYVCEVRRVAYEFQKGGNEMLVARRSLTSPHKPARN